MFQALQESLGRFSFCWDSHPTRRPEFVPGDAGDSDHSRIAGGFLVQSEHHILFTAPR